MSVGCTILFREMNAHTNLLINCLIIPHQGRSSKDIDKYLVDNPIPILCRAKPLLLIMINHDRLSAGRARCVNRKGQRDIAGWPFQELRSFRSCSSSSRLRSPAAAGAVLCTPVVSYYNHYKKADNRQFYWYY